MVWAQNSILGQGVLVTASSNGNVLPETRTVVKGNHYYKHIPVKFGEPIEFRRAMQSLIKTEAHVDMMYDSVRRGSTKSLVVDGELTRDIPSAPVRYNGVNYWGKMTPVELPEGTSSLLSDRPARPPYRSAGSVAVEVSFIQDFGYAKEEQRKLEVRSGRHFEASSYGPSTLMGNNNLFREPDCYMEFSQLSAIEASADTTLSSANRALRPSPPTFVLVFLYGSKSALQGLELRPPIQSLSALPPLTRAAPTNLQRYSDGVLAQELQLQQSRTQKARATLDGYRIDRVPTFEQLCGFDKQQKQAIIDMADELQREYTIKRLLFDSEEARMFSEVKVLGAELRATEVKDEDGDVQMDGKAEASPARKALYSHWERSLVTLSKTGRLLEKFGGWKKLLEVEMSDG